MDDDYEFCEYSDDYDPFEEPRKPRQPPAIQQLRDRIRECTDLFVRVSRELVPRNYRLRCGASVRPPRKKKLCRSLLFDRHCNFGVKCKFAHSFYALDLCRCQHVVLVGPATFFDPSGRCGGVHENESVDSYVARFGESTVLGVTLQFYRSNFVAAVVTPLLSRMGAVGSLVIEVVDDI